MDLRDDVTLFDLDPATTYDCSVAASNVIGIGPYSDPVQGTTAARVGRFFIYSTVLMFRHACDDVRLFCALSLR